MTRACILLGFLILIASAPARGAPFDNQPKILLHVAATTSVDACAHGIITDCANASITADLTPEVYFVYVLAAHGPLSGSVGVQFGITYDHANDRVGSSQDQPGDQVDILQWHHCGDVEYPSPTPVWPKPDGGNLITWNSACRTDPVAVAGYFYVTAYSPDSLWVTPRPVDNLGKIADCGVVEHLLDQEDMGFAAFSPGETTPGCNPCAGDCPHFVPRPPPGPPPPPPPPPEPQPVFQPRICVHVTGTTSKNTCVYGQVTSCNQVNTRGSLSAPDAGPYHFIYLLVEPGTVTGDTAGNFAGVQCGITYDGNAPGGLTDGQALDVFSWGLCGALEFPSTGWPAPGGGNLITWDRASDCRNAIGVAGYFYVGAYSPDIFRVTVRPVDSAAKIARCSGLEVPLAESLLGYAAFSANAGMNGCNPCLMNCAPAVPVESRSWGGIKSLFGSSQ